MRLCVFDGLDRIEIGDTGEMTQAMAHRDGEAPAVKVTFDDASQVEHFVRRHFRGSGEMHRLRALLVSQRPLAHRLPDEEVLRQLCKQLHNGHLCAYLCPHVPKAVTRPPETHTAWAEASPVGATARTVKKPAATPLEPAAPALKHWLEIELVGEDDKPIPGEAYRVKLPDGTTVSGHLDNEGFARLDQLDEQGECEVCFPNLDKAAWEKLDTRPQKGL